MRKTVSLLIVLLLVSSCAFSVRIGTGNDRWGLGLTVNEDDLLTGSFHLGQDFKDFSVDMDFLVITNRGTKEIDGEFRKGRTDILNVAFAYIPEPFRIGDSRLFLGYEASAGVSAKGPLGSEYIQNLIHSVMNNPSVDLPDAEELGFLPLASLAAYGSYNFLENMGIGLSTSYLFNSGGNQLNVTLTAKASYRGFSTSLGVDYSRIWGFGWLMQAYAENVNGIGIDFGLTAGEAITFNYRVNPLNGRSYAVFTMDTDGFKPHWKESLAKFVVTKQILSEVSRSTGLIFEHSLSDYFDAGIELRHTSGFENNSKVNNDEFRTAKTYSRWLVGLSIHKDFGFMDPYLSIRGGISQFRIDKLLNMNPESTYRSDRLADKLYPTASMEIGVRFLPEGLVIIGPTSMRISLFGGFDWFPKALEKTLEKDGLHDDWNMKAIIMHYGLGLVFGF